ncbi:MAG TPA: GntR family transcriptional regulator [Roseiarcus sp.]|nr:GntR family transcriptional regulator [Roseiarcus sp.]
MPSEADIGASGNSQSAAAPIGALTFEIDRRAPVAEQVYAALRRAILQLRLPPGTAISENSLCRSFGVSRTPVRNAILRLSEEGLVNVYPQFGSFVAPIRLAGLKDSHFLRRAVELALVREAATRWTQASAAEIHRALERQEEAIRRGDVEGFHIADEEFHQGIAAAAGREGVWPMVLAAKSTLTRFIRYTGNTVERLWDALGEHRAVVDGLMRKDPLVAEEAMATHLDQIFVLFDALPPEQRKNFVT